MVGLSGNEVSPLLQSHVEISHLLLNTLAAADGCLLGVFQLRTQLLESERVREGVSTCVCMCVCVRDGE